MNQEMKIRRVAVVTCKGRPIQGSHAPKGSRRMCKAELTIDPAPLGWAEWREEYQRQGWTRFKTLGKFGWFCPTCARFIAKKRRDSREVWG